MIFVDVETTGLDPRQHHIWEVAISDGGATYAWQIILPQSAIDAADPRALEVGGFADRYDPGSPTATSAAFAASFLRTELAGETLVGLNPAFDVAFLTQLLADHGLEPSWHYWPLDLYAAASGRLQTVDKHAIDALGVDETRFHRHSAGGDVEYAKAIYRRIYES